MCRETVPAIKVINWVSNFLPGHKINRVAIKIEGFGYKIKYGEGFGKWAAQPYLPFLGVCLQPPWDPTPPMLSPLQDF